MAVPTGKKSKAKTRQRRTINDRKVAPGVSYCQNCNSPKAPHRACPTCGYYSPKHGRVMETSFTEDGDEG